MLKKVLFASLLTATGVAMANPAPYIGAGAGVDVNTNSKGVGSFRGVPFNIFAGYGGIVAQSFYLAGELDGTLTTATISNSGNLRTTYSYGASILPGIMLSDYTLAFLRVGVVRTNFTNGNIRLTGGQFGFGLQTSVTQNVDLRGEYDFTAYKGSTKVSSVPGVSVSPRSDAFNLALIYKFD